MTNPDSHQYVAGTCPPVVWSSPTKYYPAKPTAVVPNFADGQQRHIDARSSKALLILQERLVSAATSSKEQLALSAAAFQRQIADVQEAARSKQEALQEQLVQQFCRKRQLLLLSSCVLAWRLEHQQHCKQLQQQYLLNLVLQGWRQSASNARAACLHQQAAVLHSWREQAQMQAVHAGKARKLQQRRIRKLLLAWQQQSAAQQECMIWVQRWHQKKVQHQYYSRWMQQVHRMQQLVDQHRSQWQATILLQTLQDWQCEAQQQRSARRAQLRRQQTTAAEQHKRLHSCWFAWRQQVGSGLQLAQKHRHDRLLHSALSTWLQLPAAQRRLRAIAAAVSAVYRQLLLQWGYRAFGSCCSQAVAARRAARQCLRAWCLAAAASSRQRHAIRARDAGRRRALLQGCVSGWVRVTWQGLRSAAAVHSSELKAALVSIEAQLTCQQSQVALLQQQEQHMAQLAKAASRATAPDLPLAPTLHWHCLPNSSIGSHQQLQVQPRARHATFALPVMQPAASSTQDAPNAPPQYPTDLMGCLTVFGGVAAGGSWLQDVSLLLLQDDSSAGSSGCCVQSVTVAGSCPVPVCDFAACECGPASFVVVGGFDGSAVTAPLLLQRCVLTRDSLPECSAATTAAADSTASVACSSSAAAAAAAAGSSTGVPARGCGIPSTAGQQLSSAAWAAGWQCTWDVLQPRTRSPKGRCHHSCCWHAGSGSLVVFGGYAGGCLSDVQVFNLKHMEWWQPQRAGAWPSSRRGHAAVVQGDSLWVHGGLDSSGQHLQDLWRLDLHKWQWQQLEGKAGGLVSSSCPAGRRAHALAGVQGRFLLLHGGYSGSCELLQDTWLYDTRRDCWMPVELQVACSNQPVARALHTMTYLQQRFIVVGGQTSLGPLGQVGMMCSPAVLHAQQLQQQVLTLQQHLLKAQMEGFDLQADLQICRAHRQQVEASNKVLQQKAAAAEDLAAASYHGSKADRTALSAAVQAAAAAEGRAQAAADLAEALERRLERARQGGRKALHAAAAAARQHEEFPV